MSILFFLVFKHYNNTRERMVNNMARIIKTETIEKNGFQVINHYVDGTTKATNFFEDDIVDNFKFTVNSELMTEKCRIGSVNLQHKRFATMKFINDNSCLKNDASVKNIMVDCSDELRTKTFDVSARDILEYGEDREVKRVTIVPLKKVKISILLSDNSVSEMWVQEGMDLFNVTIQKGGKETVGNYKVQSFIYNLETKSVNKSICGLGLIDDDGDIIRIYFEDIKVCGQEGIIVEDGASIANAISAFYENLERGGLVLPVATFNEPIVLRDKISIVGACSTIDAHEGSRANDITSDNETVLENTFDCSAGADVVIQGVTLTKKSNIKLNGAKSISFKNCRFVDMEPTGAKSYVMLDKFDESNQDGILLRIENCYFGSNQVTNNGKTYNLLELNGKLADGSYIKNNYFAKGVCSNNIINLYDVVPGATIEVSGNHFEYSCNAVRIGFINTPDCTVKIENNTYDEASVEPDWEGLLLIQPYGKKTKSYENLVVNLRNNKCTKKGITHRVWYFHDGPDTLITGDLFPKVYVNGKLQDEPNKDA